MQNKIKKIFANSSKKTCSKILALMLVLTFSMSFVMPMAVFAADPTISADKLTAYAGDTITITVVDEAFVAGTTVLVSGAGLLDPDTISLGDTGSGTYEVPTGLTAGENLTFTYTDASATDHSTTVMVMQAVALQSATAMGSGASTIGTGDKIQLVFDKAIGFDGAPDTLDKGDVNNILSDAVVNELTEIDYFGEWSKSGPIAGYDILTITFTSNGNATLQNGDSISLKPGLKLGHNSGYEISGTKALTGVFGTVITPEITSIVAISTHGSGISEQGDMIKVSFNTLVNHPADNVTATDGDLGTGATYNWDPATGTTILTITLGANPDVVIGTTKLNITGVMDAGTNSVPCMQSTNLDITGSFGTPITPEVLSATAISTTGKGVSLKGDQIKVVFNTIVTNQGAVVTTPNGSLGTGATNNWDSSKGSTILTITLGDNPNVIPGTTTLDITGVKDAATKKVDCIKNIGIAIGGSFGTTVKPQVMSVTAISTTGNGVASAGDKIKVVFNTMVDNTGVKDTDIVAADGNLGANKTVAWTEENGVSVLTVTLGTSPNVVPGTTKLSINGVIKDLDTKSLICDNAQSLIIQGSFGSIVAPQVVKVVALSTTGNGVASQGDIIKVIFNTLVDYSSVTGISADSGSLGGPGLDRTWTEENGVSVLTIKLGADPIITIGTTRISINGVIKDKTTRSFTCDNAQLMQITGSFGTGGVLITPHITSVTAISATGIGQAMAGDKIKVVFNTAVDHSAVTSVVTNGSFGTGSKVDWVTENGTSIMVITLGENPVIVVGETTLSIVGSVTDDLTKSATCDNAVDRVIDKGTFGVATIPSVISAVAYTDVASVDLKGEYIRILFNAATNKPIINPVSIKVNNVTNVMGTEVSAEWKSDFELLVALGADSTVKKGDTLDFSGLGIKAKDTTYFDIVKSTVNVTGELAVPVVLSAVAADGNPSTQGAAKGDTITITFSSRTNKAVNLSNLTALLGTGATASWNANGTVLTLTLGNNPTVYDAGFIVINSIGIKDAFSNENAVVGQYQITGFFGPVKEGPKVVKVSASSTDITKTTVGNGDKITIKFNAPTNQFGTKTKAQLDQIITLGAGKNLGTNYIGEWFNNDTLVITIVDSTGANIVPGVDKISIGGTGEYAIKYASGLHDGSLATNESDVLITGSFDGRAFAITNVMFNKAAGRVKVTATIDKSNLNYNGNVTVVFALYNGNTPVLINSVKMNIETKVDLESVFETPEGNTVKVFVYSDFVSDLNASPAVLANTVTKQ